MKMEEKSYEDALNVIDSWGAEKYINKIIYTAAQLFNKLQDRGPKASYRVDLTEVTPWYIGAVNHALEVLAGVSKDREALEFLQSNGKRGGGRSGVIGGPKAKEFIIFCLKEATDGWIRLHAVRVLGAVGEQEAIEHLIETLLNDQDIYVIKQAARALGAIGDKRAVEPLKTIYNSGLPSGVREAAGEAIKRILTS